MGHHHVGSRSWQATVTLLSVASMFVPLAHAASKDKNKKQQPRVEGIYLISHLSLPETTVSKIAAASDPGRELLQLTDAAGRTLTVVDVTKPEQPTLLEQSQLPAVFANASMQTRSGNSALFTATESDSSAHGDPQSVTLVNFADLSHPQIVQKFEGVTAVWNDRERELIYLTNADGLWILEVYSAGDKRAEEQFDEMLRSR